MNWRKDWVPRYVWYLTVHEHTNTFMVWTGKSWLKWWGKPWDFVPPIPLQPLSSWRAAFCPGASGWLCPLYLLEENCSDLPLLTWGSVLMACNGGRSFLRSLLHMWTSLHSEQLKAIHVIKEAAKMNGMGWIVKRQYDTLTKFCVSQGALLNAVWLTGWEGELGKNGYTYMSG